MQPFCVEALDRVVDRPEHRPLVLVVDVVVAALVLRDRRASSTSRRPASGTGRDGSSRSGRRTGPGSRSMSLVYTALSVAVVEPLPPKFSPPERLTVSGLAACHARSALPSIGATSTLLATSVLGGTSPVCVAQPAAASVAAAMAVSRRKFIGGSPLSSRWPKSACRDRGTEPRGFLCAKSCQADSGNWTEQWQPAWWPLCRRAPSNPRAAGHVADVGCARGL